MPKKEKHTFKENVMDNKSSTGNGSGQTAICRPTPTANHTKNSSTASSSPSSSPRVPQQHQHPQILQSTRHQLLPSASSKPSPFSATSSVFSALTPTSSASSSVLGQQSNLLVTGLRHNSHQLSSGNHNTSMNNTRKESDASAEHLKLKMDGIPAGIADKFLRDGNLRTFNTSPRKQLVKLPYLMSVPATQREELLRSKLKQCMVVFDFNNLFQDMEEKEVKRAALTEIIGYISDTPKGVTPRVYGDIFNVLRVNCFRTMKSRAAHAADEDDEPCWEPSWPHLHLVYSLFVKFLESPDFQAFEAKKYTDFTFITELLELFDSDDPRERDCLKTVLHRIYGHIIGTRAAIRKAMMHLFMRFIYETGRHNGIAELLEILGSIINGFQVPLKIEHIVFLEKVLLPLHKPASLAHYHPQLAYCVLEYVRKDCTLLKVVLQKGLIKFWPRTLCTKEVMFLNELEELIDIADDEQLKLVSKEVFSHIASCVSSPHFQVAERTLFFWSNTRFISFMKSSYDSALTIIFPSLYKSREHWNKNIQNLSFNALKTMMDMDPVHFNKFTETYRDRRRQEKEKQRDKARQWALIQRKALTNPMGPRILGLPRVSPSIRGKDLAPPGSLHPKLSRNSVCSSVSLDLRNINPEMTKSAQPATNNKQLKKSTHHGRGAASSTGSGGSSKKSKK